jgi:hypothetical protein
VGTSDVGGYGTDQALLRARRELSVDDGPIDVAALWPDGREHRAQREPLPAALAPELGPRGEAALPREPARVTGSSSCRSPTATREEFGRRAVRSREVLERLAEHEYWVETFLPKGFEWSAAARRPRRPARVRPRA